MNDNQDIRWKQRWTNFDKAYEVLERCLKKDTLSEIEAMGTIQAFEIVLELSWKLMKDYAIEQKFDVRSPKDSIKAAYKLGVIDDGHAWLEALDKRNLTVHTYRAELAKEVMSYIRTTFYPLAQSLHEHFNKLN